MEHDPTKLRNVFAKWVFWGPQVIDRAAGRPGRMEQGIRQPMLDKARIAAKFGAKQSDVDEDK